MKRLIIIIIITISAISMSKAQSRVKINLENLHAEIAGELSNLPIAISDIHFDWDAIRSDIDQNLAVINNTSNSIKISFSDPEDLSLTPKEENNIQTVIGNIINGSNKTNKYIYAYVSNGSSNKENNTDYSYSITESPQNTDVFNQLSKIKGIEVVYISKAMLGMMPNMDMPGVDIGNIAGKLESLEIYTAEDDATKRLIGVTDKLIESGNYETLMLIKDNDSRTAFYMKKGASNKGSEMLMITEDDSDATIIRFLGNFTIQDIKNIANQGKNININTNISTNTGKRMSEAELNMRIKEAEKRNAEAQKIAEQAHKRAIEAQKRAEERAERAEERAKRAEEKAKKVEERMRKTN